MKTYKIQNRYRNERDGAIATARDTVKALGIDLDIPAQPGIYGGDTWDAIVAMSQTSLTVVIKVYSGEMPELRLPYLDVIESDDRRLSPQW